jgi:uncharacterized protein YcfL
MKKIILLFITIFSIVVCWANPVTNRIGIYRKKMDVKTEEIFAQKRQLMREKIWVKTKQKTNNKKKKTVKTNKGNI